MLPGIFKAATCAIKTIKLFTMIIKLIPAILLMISFASVQGQNKKASFYLKMYGGYGLLTPGASAYYETNQVTNSQATTQGFQQHPLWGKGLHYGGGLGITLNGNVSIGVDAEYLNENILRTKNLSSYTNTGTTSYEEHRPEVKTRSLNVIPNVTINMFSKSSCKLYTRVGIAITVKTRQDYFSYDSIRQFSQSATGSYTSTIAGTSSGTYTFGTNFGLQAGLGLQVKIAGGLMFFMELSGLFLPVAPVAIHEESLSKVVAIQETIASKGASAGRTITTFYNKAVSDYAYAKSGIQSSVRKAPAGRGSNSADPKTYFYTYNNYPTEPIYINYAAPMPACLLDSKN
jgi:Outer membrane protein beta-barrel domain